MRSLLVLPVVASTKDNAQQFVRIHLSAYSLNSECTDLLAIVSSRTVLASLNRHFPET